MTLRIAILLCLVALAAAQTTMEPTTMEPTTMEPTTMEPTTMEPTTMAMTTETPTEAGDEDNLDARFDLQQASDLRDSHFYCLSVNQTMFPTDILQRDGQIMYRRWALFLQYPILNYLDTMGKTELLRVTAQLVQNGNNPALSTFNESDFCIANVVHYGVSTYEESILINLYFRGDTVINENNPSGVPIADFNEAFRMGYMAAAGDVNSDLVQMFLERNAYVINLPGARSQIEELDEDPTQRAILLGYYIGDTTIDEAKAGMVQEFAENPNPINFGLEAGDIIFAVFGSIFLTIVGGLVLLGFCIHPFFLA